MNARSSRVPALLALLVLPAGAISFAAFAATSAAEDAAGFSPAADATTTAVDWSVEEGPDGGTVDANGVYTAPATAGTYHVVATSTSNPDAGAVAQITVSETPPPDIIPITQSFPVWRSRVCVGPAPRSTTLLRRFTPAVRR